MARSDQAPLVATRVLDIIAEMSGVRRDNLDASRALRLDSLTAIGIVTRIEAAFGVSAGDQVFALLIAGDVGAVTRLIVEKLLEQRANPAEITGNDGC